MVDVEATPDSISVNPSVGLADILPPLTEGESHLKGVHTRFIKYLRPARTTQSGTNWLEAEADSEPAHSQEATPPSRENPRVNDLIPGGTPPPEEAANVTHPPWEVTQGEPSANEREQDLKKVTSHSALDDDSAGNSETQKDEVSQFLSSRSEDSSIAKDASSRVDQALKKVTSSHPFPGYDPVKGNAQKDEHTQFFSNALKESTLVKGSSSDEDQALKKVPSSDTVLRQSENENPLRGLISAIRTTSTRMTGLYSTKSPGVPRMNKLLKRIHVLKLLATSTNAFKLVRDIPPRNSESISIPEEQTEHSEENSLNVDTLLKEDAMKRSNSTAGVYSRFKRRRRPKVRRGPDDTVKPKRGMDHSEMETSSLKRSADSRVRSRHVAFDPIVREIPVSIQGKTLKEWTPDSDTEPMDGIPLDLGKETGATFNSFQRYNDLNPRDRHVSFNPIVEEISGHTEVPPVQGENDNRPHTAPKRVFSRDLFVTHRIVDHGWNDLDAFPGQLVRLPSRREYLGTS